MTDDRHHSRDDCLLVGGYLNYLKATHKAFKTREALANYCREHDISESESEHYKMCAIIRPIIDKMIARWGDIRNIAA
jgi:hypothetical protein